MHNRAVATRFWQTIADFALVAFGICMMTYTTGLTIDSWVRGEQDKTPGYCDDLRGSTIAW